MTKLDKEKLYYLCIVGACFLATYLSYQYLTRYSYGIGPPLYLLFLILLGVFGVVAGLQFVFELITDYINDSPSGQQEQKA